LRWRYGASGAFGPLQHLQAGGLPDLDGQYGERAALGVISTASLTSWGTDDGAVRLPARSHLLDGLLRLHRAGGGLYEKSLRVKSSESKQRKR